MHIRLFSILINDEIHYLVIFQAIRYSFIHFKHFNISKTLLKHIVVDKKMNNRYRVDLYCVHFCTQNLNSVIHKQYSTPEKIFMTSKNHTTSQNPIIFSHVFFFTSKNTLTTVQP